MHKSRIAHALEKAGLTSNRVLVASQRNGAPSGEWYLRNAAICSRRHGVIWRGDLDLTSDDGAITKVAGQTGCNLFVVTSECVRHSSRPSPADAVWWTKTTLSGQDDFIAAKHYEVWHPSRKKEPKPQHVATGPDWQSRVVMLETEGDRERWKGEVSTGRGKTMAPALLQRSGPFELLWLADNCAITQPAYHQLRTKFEKLEFVSHPDRAAIHVRHRGSLVALVWPCSVPNRITSAAARNELAVRAVLDKKENPLGPFLRRRLSPAANHGPEALWLAVQKLLQLTENMEASSTVWTLQGVTDWRECSAVEFKEVHYVFNGTDVPVASLFQHLRDGSSVDDFLAAYPSVAKQQVQRVLDHAALTLFA